MKLFVSSFVFACLGAASVWGQANENGSAKVVRTPLVLREGGTPEKPAVFDGQGMVIDLGTDVSDEKWTKAGELWTSVGPLLGQETRESGNFPGLFVDEVPIVIPRDREAEKRHPDRIGRCYVEPEKLLPGQMGYSADGSCYFRWPTGKTPEKNRVILPPQKLVSGVTIACSHIIVKNVTAMHAGNDGFNIHGAWVGIRVENCRGFSNCDEGISAHDDVQMDVVDSEFAWNGSTAGGVADVNRCATSYRNCQVHDNVGAGFHFTGKSHRVSDCLIYNQQKDFHVGAETKLERERVEWRK
jgi:hypothetical protein